ncbi:MAG: hypothetical protein M1402_03105 [Candidatus Thermoplasmatota archaeon]|nr:hypothetical protein [Candidatus Thermoplasmatota archaeon]
MPYIILTGKFAYVVSISVWSGSLFLIMYMVGRKNDPGYLGLSSFLMQKGRIFLRVVGIISVLLSFGLVFWEFENGRFHISVFSLELDFFIILITYSIIGELYIIPAMKRFHHISEFTTKSSGDPETPHVIVMSGRIRELCLYQIIPLLFVVLTISLQYSIS